MTFLVYSSLYEKNIQDDTIVESSKRLDETLAIDDGSRFSSCPGLCMVAKAVRTIIEHSRYIAGRPVTPSMGVDGLAATRPGIGVWCGSAPVPARAFSHEVRAALKPGEHMGVISGSSEQLFPV
jgi:hypothetical protein